MPDPLRDMVLILKSQFENHQRECDRRYESLEEESRERHEENKAELVGLRDITKDQNKKIDKILWASLTAAGSLLFIIVESIVRYFMEHGVHQ